MVQGILVALVAAASVCSALPSQNKGSKCKMTMANGNFESGQMAPWEAVNEACWLSSISSPGADGSQYAANLTLAPPQPGVYAVEHQISQSFNWCIGTAYTVSFEYKTAGTPTTPWVDLFSGAGNDSTRIWYDQGGVATAQDPTYKSVSVKVPAATKSATELKFTIFNSEATDLNFFLDNVKITPTKH